MNKEIIALSVDYTHIIIPCEDPKKCGRETHLFGSNAELHSRTETRVSHCDDKKDIDIIIDKSTRRPFFFNYKPST